jgi:hypothetical protein
MIAIIKIAVPTAGARAASRAFDAVGVLGPVSATMSEVVTSLVL